MVRVVNMRSVDLRTVDFDFDLTWAALFMNAAGHVYGRYGSRDEGSAEAGLSLKGLKYAMQQSLDAYQADRQAKPQVTTNTLRKFPALPEKFPAARRLKANACIHCHQVNNFHQDLLWNEKRWTKAEMWQYPPAKSLGMKLDLAQGDRIESVVALGAGAKAGLKAGDVLALLGGFRISSEADVQYALNRAPVSGTVFVAWTRNGKTMAGRIPLAKGWRRSDISWRASTWTIPPAMGIYGKNLTVAEKAKFDLKPKRLAFRQGKYVPPKTRRAGIRARDIIIGVDGKPLEMTMLQFNTYMKTNYDVGDKVLFDVIRGGRRMKIPMTLPVNPR
jgi:hypothetical protein